VIAGSVKERPLDRRRASAPSVLRAATRLAAAVGVAVCLALGAAVAQETDALTDDGLRLGPVSFFSYGRVGVNTLLTGGLQPVVGMNLQGLGSIGGRLEEADYIETGVRFHLLDPDDDYGTRARIVLRHAFIPRQSRFIGAQATLDLEDVTLTLPEAYAEADNLLADGLGAWVGARFYRGPDVHIADYYYFNDLSGQGGGLRYRGSELAAIIVSPDLGSASRPQYVFESVVGADTLELRRQRVVVAAQHRMDVTERDMLHLLAEVHRMGRVEALEAPLPADIGYVAGIRWNRELAPGSGSFTDLSVRFGTGIANGGAGNRTRTWRTFGATESGSGQFTGAYALTIVNHTLLNFGGRWSLNPYAVFLRARGGAEETRVMVGGEEVLNRREEVVLGGRSAWYLTDRFHLLGELHVQQRREGGDRPARVAKLSVVPSLVPNSERSVWARPHLRLVYTVAIYDDVARERLYSPYLQIRGARRTAHMIGLQTEWWF
jgi:maltoporin